MAAPIEVLRKTSTVVATIVWLWLAVSFDSYWNERSIIGFLLFGLGCVATGLGVLGRIWCLSFIAGHKKHTLIVDGPYSVCRNPLYLFSLLGVIGIGLGTCTLTIPLLAVAGFAFYYPMVMNAEFQRLSGLHGDTYAAYVKRTPAFFPNWRLYHEDKERSVDHKAFRRGLFDSIWFLLGFGVMHFVSELHDARFCGFLFVVL